MVADQIGLGGVTPVMMGIYGEHNKDARNAAVLASVQESLH